MQKQMETVTISTPFIKLDSFLKLSGAAPSGGEAKAWIAEGGVLVNGEAETRRGRKLYPGDTVALRDMDAVFVVEQENA